MRRSIEEVYSVKWPTSKAMEIMKKMKVLDNVKTEEFNEADVEFLYLNNYDNLSHMAKGIGMKRLNLNS